MAWDLGIVFEKWHDLRKQQCCAIHNQLKLHPHLLRHIAEEQRLLHGVSRQHACDCYLHHFYLIPVGNRNTYTPSWNNTPAEHRWQCKSRICSHVVRYATPSVCWRRYAGSPPRDRGNFLVNKKITRHTSLKEKKNGCCCWLLGGSMVAALYNNSSLFVARSQISVSSAVTALLADDINFASHNASHNSDLIGHKITCRSKYLPVKFITLPLSLGPVPRWNRTHSATYAEWVSTSVSKYLIRAKRVSNWYIPKKKFHPCVCTCVLD